MIKTHLIVMPLLLLVLWSCTEQIKPVNNDKSLWGKYCLGETYTTLDELFILEVKDGNKKILALSPAGNKSEKFRNYYSTFYSKDNKTLVKGSFYQAPTTFLTSIPKGSEITITEIKQKYTFHWFFGEITVIVIYGEMTSSKTSIQPLDLTNISYRYEIRKNYYLSKPNKNFLESQGESCHNAPRSPQ